MMLSVSHLGTTIPETVYAMFQLTFAIITPALICGSFAERMKFSAMLWFMGIWLLVVYCPIAHWVWEPSGWLAAKGVLDFAGGTVVHINAGVAGLVGAFVLGKRIGFGREPMAPHSLTMTMIGASLLWFGWFGFNAGSALEANGIAALAFMNTYLATACAVLAWIFMEWLLKGKPSMLGAASGAVAGLVAITPAAGNVGIPGAFVIGLAAGGVCLWGVTGLKRIVKADDSLDVFGIHALGGAMGALLTGIFNSPQLGGPGQVVDWVTGRMGYPGIGAQLVSQAKAVLLVAVWTAVVAFLAFHAVKFLVGIRVTEEEEREGLDISLHGERAYDL
jgi:Amt family ammonium transporter